MTGAVCGDVESCDVDFTHAAKEFFNEECWDTLAIKLIESEGEVFAPSGALVSNASDLLKELRSINPLYEEKDIEDAPFALLFSNFPSIEILDEIKNHYGNQLDTYLETCQTLTKNRSSLETLDVIFERYGFDALRNQHYRIVLKNYVFHILLNKRGFNYEFKPYISLAPKIKEDSYGTAYHELHEETLVYQFLTTTKFGEMNQTINLSLFENFVQTIMANLERLEVRKKSESEIIEYLNQNFHSLNLLEREKYARWDTD